MKKKKIVNCNVELKQTMESASSESKIQIGQYESITELTESGTLSIVNAIRAVNTFPSGASRDLYCAYPTFGKVIDYQSDRILGIISNVLKNQNIKGNIQRRQKDEQFELLLDCNDCMLERINSNLDEMAGIKKNPQTIVVETEVSTHLIPKKTVGAWNLLKKPESSMLKQSARLIAAKNILRPQVNFKTPVDNSSSNPFEPRIKDKPNSLKPLAVLPEYDEDGNIESYLHPYEFELTKFEPSMEQMKYTEPEFPNKLEHTEYIFVDTQNQLKDVVDELGDAQQIAVDVEHHSYRTFLGITCLLQISTKQKDYIIDALKLRDELYILNEIFTNPKILKIFHGADMDIEWLQRDLSLYVVNMFDTHQAAKLLSFPRFSLSYLLKHYCNIEADKTFQLADWRIRPLPEELIVYARQDTHYLIFIYESIRNDLLTQGNNEVHLLKTVYQKSTEICKKRYHKPKINSESHMDLYRKSKRVFDNRQLFALKEIFMWRDKISRQEDESYGYVLPNHMLLQISESLPREMQGILACCNPIPPLVRQNLYILHQIVLKARGQSLVKPIVDETIENRRFVHGMRDFNNKLYCPHDLSYNPDFRDDLPTLLDLRGATKGNNDENEVITMGKPIINIYEHSESIQDEEITNKLQNLNKVKFITPYERYKAVLPFAEKQRQEELAKQAEENKNKLLCPVNEKSKVDEAIDNNQDTDDSIRREESVKDAGKRKHENETDNQFKDSTLKKLKNKQDKCKGNDMIEFVQKVQIEKPDKAQKMFEITVKPTENNSQQIGIEISNKIEEEELIKPLREGIRNSRRKNKKRKKFKNKVEQSSSQPVEFDYSKVDFSKFKGGAQQAKKTEVKGKFQGKRQNNKVNKKEFNKLFTFSKVNSKK